MKKRQPSELAIFGGVPAFAPPLHVGAPNLGDPERIFARIQSSLQRRRLSNHGPLVQEFEQKIAQLVDVPHCIATCNATIALEVVARALHWTGEVLVPAFTFVATAHALEWQRITPVFCDIDPTTLTISPDDIVRRITPRTSGILAVHLWGRPCEIERLSDIADAFQLPLVFDASHALGCSHRSQPIGSFGTAEVFSFHATKFVNSLEGGAICTTDGALAERCRRMINFGFAAPDQVVSEGTNGKMNEWSAAMGLTSLESLQDFAAHNLKNYQQYRQRMARIDGLNMLEYDENEAGNYQYVVLDIDANRCSIDRDSLAKVLQADGIMARRYFSPGCHRMEPYRTRAGTDFEPLLHTDRASASLLALPTGSAVGETEIERIDEVLNIAVRHGAEIRRRLNSTVSVPAPLPIPVPAKEGWHIGRDFTRKTSRVDWSS